jgi:hypothetical protein
MFAALFVTWVGCGGLGQLGGGFLPRSLEADPVGAV